jgi:multidrug resistance efflux pump
MVDEKSNGFLFNIVSNIGDGHQIQAAFNLPVGATKADIDSITDQFFSSAKRQAARLRVPAIEMEVGVQSAKIDGQLKHINALRDKPTINGRRTQQDDAAYKQAEAQVDADKARLELLKKNLELTYKEAELPIQDSPCLIQASS